VCQESENTSFRLSELNDNVFSEKIETITFFSGKINSKIIKEIYSTFIDRDLYSLDKIMNIFNGKHIIVANAGKLSYYELEIFGTLFHRYWKNAFSRSNVAKIIYEINNNNSIYHRTDGFLYESLTKRLNLIDQCCFIITVLTEESFGLPCELRHAILYKCYYDVFNTSDD
jgi:hypothetical protein